MEHTPAGLALLGLYMLVRALARALA